ncbi:Nif11 family protein [Pseudodesulfovibrio sp. JC047]|uniref:Nif11-like leader peptide family natural product precursor n=1 Tax=Pseudodesulfovibrio sp. JC047 TaxID=2683199 RepID=UPI0013D3BF0B|nr:Nif11-like leader peptide family natural product precursor [Pseudodesulfovibrio sp. JC047]NDV20446.1 Nif11 family protein [Pseudodesulfovibrio sp. JC047]
MSEDEVTRLVNDVMSNPTLVDEAKGIKDQAGMAEFVAAKGYSLTDDELSQLWTMAVNYMGVQG